MERIGEDDFDVPMGCYDGAEIFELVITFIFSKINAIIQEQNNVGLYRDDGLGMLINLSGPNTERKKK